MSTAAAIGGQRRVIVDEPDSPVAAWHMTMPDGTILLAVNRRALETPGGAHLVESWFRLSATTRGRRFDVFPMAIVLRDAHMFAGHRYVEDMATAG